jgi:hypothetical protein
MVFVEEKGAYRNGKTFQRHFPFPRKYDQALRSPRTKKVGVWQEQGSLLKLGQSNYSPSLLGSFMNFHAAHDCIDRLKQ